MSSGTTCKTLVFTVKKDVINIKNNWEKLHKYQKIQLNKVIHEDELMNMIKKKHSRTHKE